MVSWKNYFSKTIGRETAPLHFAAHSHHPWPDVTLGAHIAYWQDSAELLDRKWGRVLGEVATELKSNISRSLNLGDASSIAFAPNTHEFVMRILSCFNGKPVRILTTNSEFHSFTRQIDRLEEAGLIETKRIEVEPFESFQERFQNAASEYECDLIYFSHVFFNSGFCIPDINSIVGSINNDDTFVVVDGYHAFMAHPVDLFQIEKRAFYIAGGYKYAMSGEGCCFMHCPPGYGPRPVDTGWFAAFGALANIVPGQVPYAEDGGRFDGATFDPSGLYRMNAVLNWMQEVELSVEAASAHSSKLQVFFLDQLEKDKGALASARLMIDPRLEKETKISCGRFLTFITEQAGDIYEALEARDVITDHRGKRLRIGFGIYQDEEDVGRLITHLREIKV